MASKTHALQEHDVYHGKVAFTRVSSSAINLSHHFSKALLYAAIQTHSKIMIGYGFIDSIHRQAMYILEKQSQALHPDN